MPRLLFLCQTLPFPPDGGVNIRAYHLLRLLAREYDITALCFYRRSILTGEEKVREGVRGLSDFAEIEAFPIVQEHNRARFAWDHLKSLASGRVYTVNAYESGAFRSRLRELVRDVKFDLVHVDSLDLSGYLDILPPVPLVIDHHNVESGLLARRATSETSAFRRQYVAHQARLMEKEERRWCSGVDLNLTVSPEDRDRLRAVAPGAAVAVVPNGVDTENFQPAYGGDDGPIFVGGYTWFPNRDGMEYFAENILPLIRERRGKVDVRWIGRSSQEVMERYRTEFGIVMTGYVDDIRSHVAAAGCFLVPLRVGGGTRLKILDAWAMGKAIVSTSIGAEGLDTRDGENILLRDTNEGFAAAVDQVLSDPALRERLGRAGRRTAEERYDWKVVGDGMLADYRKLLGRSADAGAAAGR